MPDCPLCYSNDLTPIYQPLGTRRGLSVHLCGWCGLLSSHPRPIKGDGVARVSHLADYGNLRQNKGGRVPAHFRMIFDTLKGMAPHRILDVGASRGIFTMEALYTWDYAIVNAVEPDASITDWWVNEWQSVLMERQRIEDVTLKPRAFDLIYLSHTLEHLDTPLETLIRLRDALTPRGRILVEVPNIRGLFGVGNLVEEIFLDKHNQHFSANTLRKMLRAAGLTPIHQWTDTENLTIIAGLGEVEKVPRDSEPLTIKPMAGAYAYLLRRNLKSLELQAMKLNRVVKQVGGPALISGGGRILSALVEAGLDTSKFEGVIDPHLPLEEVHGLGVMPADMIGVIKPRLVLVCSRANARKMEQEVKNRWKEARLVRWDDDQT